MDSERTPSSFQVRPVASRRDLRRFVAFPYAFYRDNAYWVPPLRREVFRTLHPKKNPFFEHGEIQPFLAEDSAGRILGRIAAVVNGMHLKTHADGNGFFGFFECVEREDVARALLDAACEWLARRGLSGVRGPANPSLNDVSGLLVRGFDREPSILMPYNPPYHEEYLLRYGFERAMTMWAYYVHRKYVQTERLRRGVEIVKRRNPGLELRTLDMRRFEEDTRVFIDIYNDAWSGNWGHVPLTEAEAKKLARDMRPIIDPSLVFILEREGEPVAFSASFPDANQLLRKLRDGRLFPFGFARLALYARFGAITDIRTALLGVLRKYHGRGFDAILNLATIDEGYRRGYQGAELSWVLDSNRILRNVMDDLGAVVDKEYALFEKRF
ncbi:MAG: hypothetical protein ACUVYA_02620 [Planctomycetota bacterium]